jgi:hypothetical protein
MKYREMQVHPFIRKKEERKEIMKKQRKDYFFLKPA